MVNQSIKIHEDISVKAKRRVELEEFISCMKLVNLKLVNHDCHAVIASID